ncbi:hypothetical protein G7068_04895 [Leucobacter viscericola]|uniref:Uncharacterized protein n=1 Tax=Leucobacter viscericola TaxID=2714935 RepID=A0A6G7XDD5_9MICO|nr:hypothetical protein [Leucobacter viscericola]QIK62620.1 hypothetical protein G7068_04895 [Leucobacter viscericola]
MSIGAGLVMAGAGALCLSAALASKRWIAVAVSVLMLAAMLDSAFLSLVPVVVWAAALLAAGIVLGINLRIGRGAFACVSPLSTTTGQPRRLEHSVLLTVALAYPATAWLLLAHGGGGANAAVALTGEGDAHRAHSAAMLTGSLPAILIGALAAVLLTLAVLALRSRRRLLATDAGGMGLMLAAMLLMH